MILFAVVVREGSFTRAATKLGITKQSVSERIAKLEDALGVRLLERTTRQLRVTNSGATYFERCSVIAEQVNEANSEVQQREVEPVGLLRVASPTMFGRRFLGPVVAAFMREHPRVAVELVLADRRVNVVEEGFDVAIVLGTLDDSSLISKKLTEAPVHYVASPGYLKKYGVPKTLRGARCIGFSPFETWDVGGVKTRIDPVLMVNDSEFACDAALRGLGVARLPSLLTDAHVKRGTLKVLFASKTSMRRTIHVVYPSRAFLPAKVRAFVDLLTTVDAQRRFMKTRSP
ncbi:MAG: LysR family transcriptional regulator [Archangium sp.]